MAESWRVCMICTIRPIADAVSGTLRALGHEPVALLAPRRPQADEQPDFLRLTPASAPAGVDLLFAKNRWSIERLLRVYEPDLTICWGFPWKIPQEALDVARLGSINGHPALLPRHRGPIPFAWTLRSGDTDWGFTWHRMDAELDTGNILSQGSDPIRDDDCDIGEFGPRLLDAAVGLLTEALERVAAGDPGDPQPKEGVTWAGHFEDDDYVRVDWSQPARRVHDQVRAWQFTFGMSGLRAPHRGARRGGGRAPADAARRSRRRCAPRRVRRRADLDRGERARLANPPAGREEIIRVTEGVALYVRGMWRFVIVLIAAVAVLAPTPSDGGTAPDELAFARGGDIWTIGADGTRARPLLRDAYAPAWSPDGSRLAFVSSRSGDEEIYVARADGSGVERLTRLPGPDLAPAWSSDGRRLAWSRDAEIWAMSARGAGKRRLVARAKPWHEHYSPVWHGSAIVYSSTRVSAFNTELFRAPARRLTFTKGSDGVLGDDSMPDFTPDGRRIVFASNRDQQAEIYLMNANGTGQRRLTRRSGDDWAPDVSPDGTRIAFTQLPGTIWTMNADGTGLRRLTRGVDADWRP